MIENAPTSPSLYLFYGNDELAISEAVDGLRGRLGDPAMADVNTQRFTASGLNLGTLEEVCSVVPFLAARRLVIVENAEQLPRDEGWWDRFSRLLEGLPETTALVMVEACPLDRSSDEARYRRSSKLFAWAEAHPKTAFVHKFERPKGDRFVGWLISRCRSLGGEIDGQAAHLLAELVAEDTRLAVQELAKLLDYVDRSRPIGLADVERLTPFYGQADVFVMVDALGRRDGRQASKSLHRLLDERDARYAFHMILRQFRLLLLAREALDEGLSPGEVLSVHPYVVEKVSRQARNFTLRELEAIYRRLFELDLATKSGGVTIEVGLDDLVATLAGAGSRRSPPEGTARARV